MGAPLRILIVEDSEDDASLIIRQLILAGYEPVYERVETAQAMSDALDRREWDIVLSDYILPQFSGLAALRILQTSQPDIPCIIMSGKITDETAVSAMKAGARDYVMKDNLNRLGPAIVRELNEATVRRERAAAKKALQESNEFNDLLMKYAPNPILVINPDRSIRFINPALEELTGFLSQTLIGKKTPFPWWPQKLQKSYEVSFRKNYGKLVRHQGVQFVKKSGEELWVDTTATPIKGNDGKLLYVFYSWIDITEQKRLNEQMEYYVRKVTEAQEQERSRIARELHDDTAQVLSVLTLELDAILHRQHGIEEDIALRLQHLKDGTNRALEDVRRFSHELRPGTLDHLGLLAAVDQLIEEGDDKGELKIEFEVTGEEERLSQNIELAIFRIIQESLNNVRKHARATRATVRLDFDSDRLRLAICDNGQGFDKSTENEAIKNGHLGLIGLKERARLIGADLKLDSEPGHGTTVRLELEK